MVRPVQIRSFGLSGLQWNVSIEDEFGRTEIRCSKLTNCITLQRSDVLTMQVRFEGQLLN